jgi:alpha-ketoglutarate-dependent taurine dioxygenase
LKSSATSSSSLNQRRPLRLTETCYTLDTPHGLVTFPNHFLRENIKTAWDSNSLQRVDFNMWNDNVVQKCTKLSPTSWKLAFDDGTVGEFHLPPQTDNYVVDIELQPQVIWGGSVSKTSSDDILKKLSTRYSKGTGGIRFDWNELNIDRDTSSKLAAEQLGEGRAKLQRSSASARSALIEATHKYGMAIIDHVPCIPDQGIKLADAVVGAVETTNFGYKFVIKSVHEPHNLAFDSIYLQHHTDFTYCGKCPDVALFHCLNNADRGGDSLWLDGFACAEELRRKDPAAFDLLTKVNVRHMDITDKWDLQASHPTIEINHSTGKIQRIYFNERTRDSWRAWKNNPHGMKDDPQCSVEFYNALKTFEKIIETRRFHMNTPLQPGELVVFDNSRILHSRTEFEGARHMEGCYMEWGAIHATWRSLQPQIYGRPATYCGNVVGSTSGG